MFSKLSFAVCTVLASFTLTLSVASAQVPQQSSAAIVLEDPARFTVASLSTDSSSDSSTAQKETAHTPPATRTNSDGNFFSRLAHFYHDDWFPDPNAASAPAPARRALDAPLDSAPFPSS